MGKELGQKRAKRRFHCSNMALCSNLHQFAHRNNHNRGSCEITQFCLTRSLLSYSKTALLLLAKKCFFLLVCHQTVVAVGLEGYTNAIGGMCTVLPDFSLISALSLRHTTTMLSANPLSRVARIKLSFESTVVMVIAWDIDLVSPISKGNRLWLRSQAQEI
jgi:hypothetical protein